MNPIPHDCLATFWISLSFVFAVGGVLGFFVHGLYREYQEINK